jgi:hypothetical protein
MPSGGGVFIWTKNLLGRRRLACAAWKGVEASFNLVVEQCSPWFPILDEKEVRVEFKENIVIGSNTMNGCKVFRGVRDMENII